LPFYDEKNIRAKPKHYIEYF